MMSLYYLKRYPFCLLLALFIQAASSDTVYVCDGEGEGGSVLFSDKPCRTGQGQTLRFPDIYTSGEGLSELEKKQLEEIRAKEEKTGRETIKLSPADTENHDVPKTKAANNTADDKLACQEAKDSLKEWGRVMSLGYSPEQKETMEGELHKRLDRRNQVCATLE